MGIKTTADTVIRALQERVGVKTPVGKDGEARGEEQVFRFRKNIKGIFCPILVASVESGVNTLSPTLLKMNLEKAGFLVSKEWTKSERNVIVKVMRPETKERRAELNTLSASHAKAGRKADSETCLLPDHTVVARAQAPSENEALILAVCVECQTELKLPRSSEPL